MEKAVDFTRLEKNIIEVIQEEQIKLGYRSELIRLYYPITSLNRFFHTDAAEKEMSELLAEFSKKTVQTLGGVEISNKGERFCIAIPPSGVDYVHEHTNGSEFISSFIENNRKTWLHDRRAFTAVSQIFGSCTCRTDDTRGI